MKYKRFVSSQGLEILVGQDDQSNDNLTFKIAHANDLWFHVSGFPGSHVVLRCGTAAEEPNRNSIGEAAALAAWFSKMRNGRNVAVHYCLARHVSKPRGAKAGSVTISQFRKVKVNPSLLESPEQ